MRFLIILLLALLPGLASAQGIATLIADDVQVFPDNTLVAEGNVEALYEGQRLRASRITYSQADDLLTIEGPITFQQDEDLLVLADQGEMDPRFENGILRGARMVLDQQLQISSNQINRAEGRYTQSYQTTVSSCQVCAHRPVPLWSIRSTRVTHDELEKQIYFDNARLRVMDVPIFYLPRLRVPDPTLERARGFLTPSIRSTSKVGTGLRLPYFIPLGDSADITLTPFITEKSRTAEFRYRQAFRKGSISAVGAISSDSLKSDADGLRGYFFGRGSFVMPANFRLTFDIEAVSDDNYLRDYSYTGKDRLDSHIGLSRYRRDDLATARITNFETLRNDERNETQPTVLTEIDYERRLFPAVIGGELTLRFDAMGFYRESEQISVGRDVNRLSGRLEYERDWISRFGLLTEAAVALNYDVYRIEGEDDANFDDQVTQLTPYAGLEFRLPMARSGASGARHVIEPIAQFVWSDNDSEPVPNEDSTRSELDEGNLLSFNRFSGTDQYERGARATLAMGYTRFDPDGWSLGLTVGRSFREEDLGQFTETSGLNGLQSDWLTSIRYDSGDRLSLIARGLMDDDFDFNRAEFRADWDGPRFNLGTSYIWQAKDAEEDRDEAVSEWTVDTRYRLARHWITDVDWRYDFAADQASRARIGLTYRNECVTLGVAASRRFAYSDSGNDETTYDFSVALNGFGTSRGQRSYARSCIK
ncbi:LPS-assembly protein LptD [Cognatishimia sp. MH4019]|uniref:LPS-assembly protein LptD n=1 Tax=Cognatishimia sp. MH4019 TaxID=2854030 RepID=UPI001CD3F34E|nr:LPS assembly protein LptD [Cognatishimia sp. MH4019]